MWVRFRYFLVFLVILAPFSSCKESGKVNFTTSPEVNLDLDDILKRGYINALVDNNSTSYFIYKGLIGCKCHMAADSKKDVIKKERLRRKSLLPIQVRMIRI